MQKLLTFSLLSFAVIIAGCSRGQDTTPSLGDDTVTNDPQLIENMDFRQTGIEVCDKYLALLRCIAVKAGGDIATNYMHAHASLLQSWITLPADQVTQSCSIMTDSLQNNVSELEKYGCKI